MVFFLHCICWFPLRKINWLWVCGFAPGLSLLFRWSRGLFLYQDHCCFGDCCSVVSPELWGGLCLLTYSVLRISLAILGHLWFHIKFSIIGSSSSLLPLVSVSRALWVWVSVSLFKWVHWIFKDLLTVLHSGSTAFCSQQQYNTAQPQCNSSPHSVQRLSVDILITEVLIIVVPHCGCNLHFINNKCCWASILCFLAIWMSSLGKCICRYSARFLIGLLMFLLLSWMSCFCIL